MVFLMDETYIDTIVDDESPSGKEEKQKKDVCAATLVCGA
jgi:hypothetical protein